MGERACGRNERKEREAMAEIEARRRRGRDGCLWDMQRSVHPSSGWVKLFVDG